jgi:competence protein ComEA
MKRTVHLWLGLAGIGTSLWIIVIIHHHALSQPTPLLPPDSSILPAVADTADRSGDTLTTATATDTSDSPTADCININTDDAKRLRELPGVGPVLAERIIAFRAANGPFSKAGDLKQVKGIGPVTADKVKNLICF